MMPEKFRMAAFAFLVGDENLVNSTTISPENTTAMASTVTPVIDVSFSLSEWSFTRIGLFAYALLLGIMILLVRKHSKIILFIAATTIPGIIVGFLMYTRTYDKSFIGMIIYTAGFAVIIPVIFGCIFWFLPFSASATVLAILLLAILVFSECSTGVSVSVFYLLIPIFVGVLIACTVYSISNVPLIRGKGFRLSPTKSVKVLEVIVTCLAASFLLISGCMYFIRSDHQNLISILNKKLDIASSETCQTTVSIIGLSAWMGSFLLTLITRTPLFDRMVRGLWIRIRRNRKVGRDRAPLINDATTGDGQAATEFGIPSSGNTQ
jgi:hypothetical protein